MKENPFVIVSVLQFSEFCAYAHAAKPTDETPRIEECIRLLNGVTTWVVSNILKEATMVKRASVIEKFIECMRVGSSLSLHFRCEWCALAAPL